MFSAVLISYIEFIRLQYVALKTWWMEVELCVFCRCELPIGCEQCLKMIRQYSLYVLYTYCMVYVMYIVDHMHLFAPD